MLSLILGNPSSVRGYTKMTVWKQDDIRGILKKTFSYLWLVPSVSLFVISTEYCSDALFLCAVHCSQSLHWFGFRVICTLEIQVLHTALSIAYITINRHTIRCGLSCWVLMWAFKEHKLFWLAGSPARGVWLVGFFTRSLWLDSVSAWSWWGSSCRVLVMVVWGRCRRKSWW